MSFDNLCKYLSEKYPDAFATWILIHPPSAPVEVLKTELSIEPIRAGFITFLSTQERILYLKFQVKVAAEPPLSLRMLDYFMYPSKLYRSSIASILPDFTASTSVL